MSLRKSYIPECSQPTADKFTDDGYQSDVSNLGDSAANLVTTNCNVETGDPNNLNYEGCKYVDGDASTYGTTYPGGVWAMQWTSNGIKVWFWRYGQVPSDVTAGKPKVSSNWGTPRAHVSKDVNI